MKTNTPTKSKTGFTLVEMLVVLVLAIFLGIILWPANHGIMAGNLNCINNLKEIGLSLTIYADDNDGRFPLQIAATNTSLIEIIYNNHVFPRYQVASNELGNDPKILLCPFDITRRAATNFETLTDSNISYFFNADAVRNSSTNSILSGDRFLESNGRPVSSRLLVLTTNLNMSWTSGIHKSGGNVLLSDGSVQQTTSSSLPSIIRSQLLATNRLLIP
ncbi:MAG TPA: prepilin-type N-terminal cleavage/methylation domain-containing protein [Verrucomicrobiae bacterium]